MNAEIVEIYIPRRLEYLSGLYAWLKNELHERPSPSLFRGFSLYEVSGAYSGDRLYTEQTLIVRLIFDRATAEDEPEIDSHELKLRTIADEVVRITGDHEEEIWLIRTPVEKVVRRREGV